MKSILIIILLLCTTLGFAQKKQSLETIEPQTAYENIHVEPVYENEHASYYLIWIKQSVKSHKHLEHTESITVIDGVGIMTIGEQQFEIKKGDFFIIPKDTFHSLKVTSKVPVKVLSVQMPKFNKADRIFEEK
ncbi:MAG: cupin domain-containing protein [Flavobacteriales bacterium]|nr:cupin domain-containing protein [Flavobacteriales bacterium]MCW8913337.1 cupin domain-containing protein [Flavobacteriales bacterium]MCW8936929.1 cupin domain-containing protein [Flavobacteriales bacterium]MCW8939342.1 cupin domain-containing protein [Flavobacteriales bacterium]MCW8968610.1 cupin domain-containing protein [Flavobacteriales bacterium]